MCNDIRLLIYLFNTTMTNCTSTLEVISHSVKVYVITDFIVHKTTRVSDSLHFIYFLPRKMICVFHIIFQKILQHFIVITLFKKRTSFSETYYFKFSIILCRGMPRHTYAYFAFVYIIVYSCCLMTIIMLFRGNTQLFFFHVPWFYGC